MKIQIRKVNSENIVCIKTASIALKGKLLSRISIIDFFYLTYRKYVRVAIVINSKTPMVNMLVVNVLGASRIKIVEKLKSKFMICR